MKILLFADNASRTHTNLAVRSLRCALRDHQIEAEILETHPKEKSGDVLQKLYESGADIFGFSIYLWNLEDMLRYARALKTLCPDVFIFFGGPEVSYETADFFRLHPYVDAILSGEGEESVVQLYRMVMQGNPPLHSIIIGNTWSRFEMSGICYDADENLDGRLLYYESSRGCPFRCAYCMSGETSGVRAKSVQKVSEDLLEYEKLRADFNVIKFIDRTFNFDVSRTKKILKILLNPVYTKIYHFEICAELLDDETIEILKKFPKAKIQVEVGVQSTYTPALQSVKRPQKTEILLKRLTQLKALGNIHVHADLICGLPHENFDRLAQSFDDVYPCCHKLQLGFLKLLRGTSLRREAEQFGFSFLPDPPYTVLKSNALTYEELRCLNNIAETLDRFHSGSFEMTVAYLIPLIGSSFLFYRKLTETFKQVHPGLTIHQLSQRRAYELLYTFGKQLCQTPEDHMMLASSISFDFILHEAGTLPSTIPKDSEDMISAGYADEIKKRFLERNKKAKSQMDSPSFLYSTLEVHRFHCLSGRTVIVDRRFHQCYSVVHDGKYYHFEGI